jgi:putative colanic acid biosynthesis acetyltransferase WcaF
MPKEIAYNAAEALAHRPDSDPYKRPAFSVGNRLRRVLWNLAWLLLCRFTPRPLHAWRAFVLRCFGARIAGPSFIYPTCTIWAPWNLVCAGHVTIGVHAEVYNPAPIHLGSHVILSQQSYLCGATHDYNDAAFPLLAYPMRLGAYAWVCARASVAPGVNLGEGAVLGLGAVATRDLDPWSLYLGNPAVKIKDRMNPGSAV